VPVIAIASIAHPSIRYRQPDRWSGAVCAASS